MGQTCTERTPCTSSPSSSPSSSLHAGPLSGPAWRMCMGWTCMAPVDLRFHSLHLQMRHFLYRKGNRSGNVIYATTGSEPHISQQSHTHSNHIYTPTLDVATEVGQKFRYMTTSAAQNDRSMHLYYTPR
jgi:hypothetical protein